MYNLIVADCSPSIFNALRSVLSESDYEIFPFSDGTEVIQSLEAIKPDAILLNLFLKAKDGYDVCHFINNHERFHKIPIIFLRGAFEPVDEKKLAGLKYRELVEEPFDSQKLALKIKEAIEGADVPLILPEEPVLEEKSSLSSDSNRNAREWVLETLALHEEKIKRELYISILDEVKKLLGARGSDPFESGTGSGDKE